MSNFDTKDGVMCFVFDYTNAHNIFDIEICVACIISNLYIYNCKCGGEWTIKIIRQQWKVL